MAANPDPAGAQDLGRLRRERENADRLYNAMLTQLDHAVQRLHDMPPRPGRYDDTQIGPLNEQWKLLPTAPVSGGWLKRLRNRVVWGAVAPLFARQEAFNASLVDHVNRNRAAHRELVETTAAILAIIREEFERVIDFESTLVQFAQQITPYVDTKDRYVAALPNSLAAGISALSDELHMRWESMSARERRYEAQVNDVRASLSVLQRAVQTLRRELERTEAPTGTGTVADASRGNDRLDSYKYVAFEDQFRGSQHDIRDRMTAYVADFEGATDVLDVGCGRGEFLELLREKGISARGVDLNEEMAAVARGRGLDVTAGDSLSYLLGQPDGSLGGLFSAQVVEHLEPTYLMRLLDAAYHKLRPGSTIVLETINAACWYAFFSSYLRDFTHVRPLHPDTLRYLVVASGFQEVEIRYSAPFPEESKLQAVPASLIESIGGEPSTARAARDAAGIVNENVARLNALLFTYMDYAVIGKRL